MSALDSLYEVIPENEREEIKKLVAEFILLPRKDRSALLTEVHSKRIQQEIEKSRK